MALTALADVSVIGDAALVGRARMGDREAFAHLVERRADRMLRTARAILRNDAEAHDAVEQALVSAWVHLPKLARSRPLRRLAEPHPHQRLPGDASASRPIARGRLGWFERRSVRSRRWQPRDHVNPGGLRTPLD